MVRQKIKNLKINSAPRSDNIEVRLLKHCINSLSSSLAKIMSNYFKSSIVPDAWRCTYVTPIFKKGDKLSADNYIDNQTIPDVQHGFLKGRSITTDLLLCLNEWSDSLDKYKPIDVIYLDFSRGFDRVPHQQLLYKLEHQGIRAALLAWISSFFNSRSFRVRVDR